MGAPERNDLLELLDDRIGSRSTLITSQLPVKDWHTYLNDPTLADQQEITLSMGSMNDLALMADGTRVKQVVLNLLSNAIKYNRRGGHVWLEAQPEGDKLDG